MKLPQNYYYTGPQAIQLLLHDEDAKRKAEEFSKIMEKWDSLKMAAELLYEKFVIDCGLTMSKKTIL